MHRWKKNRERPHRETEVCSVRAIAVELRVVNCGPYPWYSTSCSLTLVYTNRLTLCVVIITTCELAMFERELGLGYSTPKPVLSPSLLESGH